MEALNLKNMSKSDLEMFITNPDYMSLLRESEDVLEQAFEKLDSNLVVNRLIKNKYCPEKLVLKHREPFVNGFLENNFNPGTNLILALASYSNTDKDDLNLSKLIKTFNTNKYDANFINSIINLSESNDLILKNTITTLTEINKDPVLLLQVLKEKNTDSVIKVFIESNEENVLKAAYDLIYEDVFNFAGGDRFNKDLFVPLYFKLKKINYGWQISSDKIQFLKRLLYNRDLVSDTTSDGDAASIAIDLSEAGAALSPNINWNRPGLLDYRKAFEHIEEIPSNFLFNNVPFESRFFNIYYCTVVDTSNVTVEEIWNKRNMANAAIDSFLKILLDHKDEAGVIGLIKSNEEVTCDIKEYLTPSKLVSFLRGKKNIAECLAGLLPSNFKKMLIKEFNINADEVGGAKLGIKELFEQVNTSVQKGLEDFLTALNKFHPKGSIQDKMNEHYSKSKQSSYKNINPPYITNPFINGLLSGQLSENDSYDILYFLLKLGARTKFDNNPSKVGILKTDLALDLIGLMKPVQCYLLCKTRESFISKLGYDYFLEVFNEYYANEDLIKDDKEDLVKEFLERTKDLSSTSKIEIYGDDAEKFRSIFKLISKADGMRMFDVNALEHYDIVWKNNEKFTKEEVLASFSEVSGYSGKLSHLRSALFSLGEQKEFYEIVELISEYMIKDGKLVEKPKSRLSKDFKKGMPGHSGNRSTAYGVIKSANDILKEYSLTSSGASKLKLFTDVYYSDFEALYKSLKAEKCKDFLNDLYNENPDLVIDVCSHIDFIGLKLDTRFKCNAKRIEIYNEQDIDCLKLIVPYLKNKSETTVKFKQSSVENDVILKTISTCKELGLKLDLGRIKDLTTLLSLPNSSEYLTTLDLSELSFSDLKETELEGFLRLNHSTDRLVDILTALLSGYSGLSKDVIVEKFVSLGIQLDYEISLYEYDYTKVPASCIEKLKSIGVQVFTENEFKLRETLSKIFNKDGSLADFESIELDHLNYSDIISIIKMLPISEADRAKYLAMNREGFILVHPKNSKNLKTISVNDMKEMLGFGAPNGLTKEQRQSLSDFLVFKSEKIKHVVSKVKSILSRFGISNLEFSDIFNIQGEIVVIKEGFERINSDCDTDSYIFKTFLKDLNKSEVFSLLVDGENSYYFRDTIRAFNDSVSIITKVCSLFENENVNTSNVLSAMAGDNSVAQLIREGIKDSNERDTLVALEEVVKLAIVNVSIARKNSKTDAGSNLARLIHDHIYSFRRTIDGLNRNGHSKKEAQKKNGYEKLNGFTSDEKHMISDKNGAKHFLYFPENLGEVKEIGSSNGWCTSYNNHYFEETLSGKAILFNIKTSDNGNIIGQGFVNVKGNNMEMSQLMGPNNKPIKDRFSSSEIFDVLRQAVKLNKKLAHIGG